MSTASIKKWKLIQMSVFESKRNVSLKYFNTKILQINSKLLKYAEADV